MKEANRKKEEKIKEVEAKASEKVYKKLAKALYPIKKTLFPDMDEKELAEVVTEFKCSLYDDLLIKLEDIFANLI